MKGTKFYEMEKFLKRNLKGKVSLSKGVIVAFLILGGLFVNYSTAMADESVKDLTLKSSGGDNNGSMVNALSGYYGDNKTGNKNNIIMVELVKI